MGLEIERGISHNEMGMLLLEARDHAGARRHFGQALEMFESAYGLWHPRTAGSLSNLGQSLWLSKEYGSARLRFFHAMAIMEYQSGQTHPELPTIMSLLGLTYSSEGSERQSVLWLSRAVVLHDRLLGRHHPGIAVGRVVLATKVAVRAMIESGNPMKTSHDLLAKLRAEVDDAIGPLELQLEEGHGSVDAMNRVRAELHDDTGVWKPDQFGALKRGRFWYGYGKLRLMLGIVNGALRKASTVAAFLRWLLIVFWAMAAGLAVVIVLRDALTPRTILLFAPIPILLVGAQLYIRRHQREFFRDHGLLALAEAGPNAPFNLRAEALAAFEWAVHDRNNKDMYASEALADMLSMMNRNEESLREYSKILKRQPNDVVALRHRGAVHLNLGHHDAAMKDLSKAIDLNDHSTYGRSLRGQLHQKCQRYSEALTDFDRAIELNPESFLAWYGKGETHRMMGKFAEAVDDFDHAMEVAPADHDVWESRGAARRGMGRHEDALTDLTHALQLTPTSTFALRERAETYRAMNRYKKAIADFDRLLELDPKHHLGWYGRGEALRDQGRYRDAIANYDRALALKPDDSDALESRGAAKRKLGQLDDASIDLERALQLNPESAFAARERRLLSNMQSGSTPPLVSGDDSRATEGDLLVGVNLASVVTHAIDLAVLEQRPDEALDTRALLQAIMRVDTEGDWSRIHLRAGSLADVQHCVAPDADPTPAGSLRGVGLTTTCEAAIRTALRVAADYDLTPLPAGVFVLGLVADASSSAALALNAGKGIEHLALIELVQEDLLDVELVDLDLS